MISFCNEIIRLLSLCKAPRTVCVGISQQLTDLADLAHNLMMQDAGGGEEREAVREQQLLVLYRGSCWCFIEAQ